MLGYQLFDSLLWAVSDHEIGQAMPRTLPPPDLPTKLCASISHLKDWTMVIHNAMDVCQLDSHPPMEAITSSDIHSLIPVNSPDTLSRHPTWLGIKNLLESVQGHQRSQFNRILMNVHSAAFILYWHSPVGHTICALFTL